MKNIMNLIACAAVILAPDLSFAQGGILKRIKQKVENATNEKIDRKVDDVLNGGSTRQSGPATSTEKNADVKKTEEPSSRKSTIAAYSRFDFVPGAQVIYAEDFSQDNIGELPLNWRANGKGELVTLDQYEGKWMRMFPGTIYLSGSKQKLKENYTIEFDLIVDGTPPSGTRFLPTIQLGLFTSTAAKGSTESFLNGHERSNTLTILVQPNEDNGSRMKLETVFNTKTIFSSNTAEVPELSQGFHRIAHYAIQVQQQRLRFWVDGRKIFDIPEAVNIQEAYNQLFFNVSDYHFYNEGNFGLYLSNVKIAEGLPDTRHKLLEEGRFSTTGILFATNASDIQPASTGVLKEIGTVLKENGTVRVRIVGHTDSDGEEKLNMELSRKRAAAVKDYLVKEFGIAESRIESEGKGEMAPVADNKTKEGKARNRRVEFIRI